MFRSQERVNENANQGFFSGGTLHKKITYNGLCWTENKLLPYNSRHF